MASSLYDRGYTKMSQKPCSSVPQRLISSYIISPGMLVKVYTQGYVESSFSLGIIIKRVGACLGLGNDTYSVLIDGSIRKISSASIWPIEDFNKFKNCCYYHGQIAYR